MVLSLLERETIIIYNEAEKNAFIHTSSPSMKKKLDKIGKTEPVGDYCWKLEVPKDWVVIKPPRKLNLTEAQRKERASRFKRGEAK